MKEEEIIEEWEKREVRKRRTQKGEEQRGR